MTSVDGIAAYVCQATDAQAPVHTNRVTGVDHVVVRTTDWRATAAAFAALGLLPKRQTIVAHMGMTQLFYRAEVQPSPIIEVVGPSEAKVPAAGQVGHAELWGLTFVSADLDETHKALSNCTQPPWAAVQAGRRITTLQRKEEQGISLALAFMSPHVRAATPQGSRHAADQTRMGRRREQSRL